MIEHMTGKKHHILIVDDSKFILDTLQDKLAKEDVRVSTALSGEKAIELLNKTIVDVVVTDLVMEGGDGILVLEQAKKINPGTAVIIITGHGDMETAIAALRFRADDYLLKSFGPKEICLRVNRCLEHLELVRRVSLYEDILPVCAACHKVRDDTGCEKGKGKWMSASEYVQYTTTVHLTNTYCPECSNEVQL